VVPAANEFAANQSGLDIKVFKYATELFIDTK
jgi:hypothetical protein